MHLHEPHGFINRKTYYRVYTDLSIFSQFSYWSSYLFFYFYFFIVSNLISHSLYFLQGVLDRFSQIQPKLIFSVAAVVYNGKTHDHMEKLTSVVKGWRPHVVFYISSLFDPCS